MNRELKRLSTKAARGKMQHWVFAQHRKDVLIAHGESHLLRPKHPSVAIDATMCGWHEASFKAHKRYGFPAATLYPSASTLTATCTQHVDHVSCQICFDVLNDFATWVMLSANQQFDDSYHMSWDGQNRNAACGWDGPYLKSTPIFSPPTFSSLGNFGGEREKCPTCHVIYERLWGATRPEAAYLTYTTNEEAAEMLKKEGKK
jgi:hypothetical protein